MPKKPDRYRVRYTPAAVDDMDVIFSYISRDNIAAAEAMLGRLDQGIGALADFPGMGAVLSDDDYTLVRRGYRFLVVDPYLVFYRIIGDDIVIHRILHGRRDYLRKLFK